MIHGSPQGIRRQRDPRFVECVDAEFHAATGPPAEAIVQAASRLGADLVIVGNKGMRGAKRVLGSIPNSIAHHAQCSVLIVDTTAAD
jgi:nucleotide-binding universal stress UspA family protein